MAKGVRFRASADGARAEIALHGVIGWDVTMQRVEEGLRQAGGRPLRLSIHSDGGDALSGIAIHNRLARYAGRKTVLVEGIVASAASLIAMAGDEILMPANAFLMIHEAGAGVVGTAEEMRDTAEVLDRVTAAYRRTYAARTGRDEAEIAALMAREAWMTAEEAVSLGFATAVVEPMALAACGDLSRYRNVPASLVAQAGASAASADAAPAPEARPEPAEPAPDTTKKEAEMADNTDIAAEPSAADIATIEAIAARAKLGPDFVVRALKGRMTEEQARDAAIEALAAAAAKPVAPARIEVTRDEGDTLRARLADAVGSRLAGKAYSEQAREFAGFGFQGVARELLAASGERHVHRLDPAGVAERIFASAHSSSDFAGVLANSTNKAVQHIYGQFPNTWSAWCDEIDVDDFKTITAASIGHFPEVVEIPAEGGPVTFGTIGEETETYAVRERGRLVSLSRVALINDDTAAFQTVVQNAAVGAYTALRRAVFGVLTANANMADGNALFSSAHANLGTAGPLNAANFGALRALLATQRSPGRAGMSPAAAPLPPPTAVALVVSPARHQTAVELVAPTYVATATGGMLPTAYRSMTTVIEEPFLDTGNQPWYLARTDFARAVQIAYLRGRRTPEVTSAERIDHTGVTFRVLFDFGTKAVTWRTIAANLGT